jgi:hypothetical protein
MKNKNNKHHHLSIHQKLERLAHHHVILVVVMSFMTLGLVKYEAQLLYVIQNAYGEGFGLASTYTHHHETLRMPIEYGSDMHYAPISGQ